MTLRAVFRKVFIPYESVQNCGKTQQTRYFAEDSNAQVKPQGLRHTLRYIESPAGLSMEMTAFKIAVVSCSWLLSLYLVWNLWRSEQHVFFKLSLTVLVWIPVLGPLLFWWIYDFPPKVHPMFRDRSRYSSDVFDRWRAVHSDSDPQRRLEKWIAQVKRDQKENPHDPR